MMSNRDIIKEELENLGGEVSPCKDDYMMFVDDDRRIRIDVYLFDDDMIEFYVSLYGVGSFVTILVSKKVPFNDRKSILNKVENILNKNHQLIKQQNQYRGALECVQEIDNFSHIHKEFTSHFSQFGEKKSFGVVVAGCYGHMIVRLSDSLQLLVEVYLKDLDRSTVFRETLTNANYVEVFSKVDELIIEFKKKIPDVIRYAELLKESADL